MVKPPCRVVELDTAFRVNDATGRAVSYVYFASGARLSAVPDLWSRDEARAIAERIARGFTLAGGKVAK
jgi:hypothetical protein